MATDKILDLEVFDVNSSGICTADGGFVGNVTGNVTGDVTGDVTASASGSIIPGVSGQPVTKTGSRTFLTVASADADHWVTLPASVIGDEIWLTLGATGCEVRTLNPGTIAINGGTGVAAESAIAASQTVRFVCTSLVTWVATNFAADGTVSALEAAA